MSYLLQYARRRSQNARVDERLRLNRPDFDGGAEVRVFVEDTSVKSTRRGPPSPRLKLRVSDCVNKINLEFAVESAELRDNSLFKIETLLAGLTRFRDGLVAEAELYAARERRSNKRVGRSRRVLDVSSNKPADADTTTPTPCRGPAQRRLSPQDREGGLRSRARQRRRGLAAPPA